MKKLKPLIEEIGVGSIHHCEQLLWTTSYYSQVEMKNSQFYYLKDNYNEEKYWKEEIATHVEMDDLACICQVENETRSPSNATWPLLIWNLKRRSSHCYIWRFNVSLTILIIKYIYVWMEVSHGK